MTDISRRGALASLAGFAASLAGPPALAAARIPTKARIVIVGAGAGGLSVANRLAQRLDGAAVALIDARKAHYYQPGFTLIGVGHKSPGYAVSTTREYVPSGVSLIEEAAAEIDPEAKVVTTSAGRKVAYDVLVVATGLELNYAGIEGMDPALIGREGIGSVYNGPEAAAATFRAMAAFADKGGIGVFGRPATEMKCAGAPLKYTFLTEDRLTRQGQRSKAELIYNAHNRALFSVPIVAERVRMLFRERGVKVNLEHRLTAIDPGRKIATFTTPQGSAEQRYDFIHVVPPMRAPAVVRNSPLPWQTGPWAQEGWLDVDRATLRHKRYANIFAVGDVAGVPKGKTAASVKWQVPVVVDHIVADLSNAKSAETFNGYTSCPLITRIGSALLVEFDYDDNLVPSFPGVIAPLEELWVSWVMKDIALKPTYLAMLRGQA